MMNRRRFNAMAGGLLALLPPAWWIFRPDRWKDLRAAADALIAAEAASCPGGKPVYSIGYPGFDAIHAEHYRASDQLTEAIEAAGLKAFFYRDRLFVSTRSDEPDSIIEWYACHEDRTLVLPVDRVICIG